MPQSNGWAFWEEDGETVCREIHEPCEHGVTWPWYCLECDPAIQAAMEELSLDGR